MAWDREEKLLGIKAAEPDDSNSYSVTITKGLTPRYVISSATILRTIGLSGDTSFLPATMHGEYLAVSPFKKPEGIFAEVFPQEDESA